MGAFLFYWGLLGASPGAALHFETIPGASIGVPLEYLGNPPYGGGMGLEDLDGDGDLDLLVSGGVAKSGIRYFEAVAPWEFVEKTLEKGLAADLGQEKGIALADYDNDGDLDFFVGVWNAGTSRLYENDGTGSFSWVEEAYFPEPYVSSGSWGDYDGDGDLDLYLSSYYETSNALYRNDEGTFVNVTQEAHVGGGSDGKFGSSFQSVWADFDEDGDLDLHVSNDRCYAGSPPNHHYENLGGVFQEVGEERGADVCINAMGVGIGDFDRNGFPDIFVTNTTQGHVLLRNHCGNFVQVQESAGMLWGQVGWGVLFEDFDRDGWDDIFVAHAGYKQTPKANALYRNQGNGTFEEIAEAVGLSGEEENGTGVVRGDIDQDGDMDVVVLNVNSGGLEFFRNDSSDGNWLKVRFATADGGGSPFGVKLDVVAGGVRSRKRLTHSMHYLSTGEMAIYVGLGSVEGVERLVVTWPLGNREEFGSLALNQEVTLSEGSGTPLVGDPIVEICGDQVDNDCDGEVDEGYGVGNPCSLPVGDCTQMGVLLCGPTLETTVCAGLPLGEGVSEICGDGIDNDCDGLTDESFQLGLPCELGLGTCRAEGAFVCDEASGTEVCDGAFKLPGLELCGDHLDNDCDGITDEGFELWGTGCEDGAYQCADDLLALFCVPGAPSLSPSGCWADEGTVEGEPCVKGLGECAETALWACPSPGVGLACLVLPKTGEEEICGDGIDNDCDGLVDEGFQLEEACAVGEGACLQPGVATCSDSGGSTICLGKPLPPSSEQCGDRVDNDCDGTTDEGFEDVGKGCVLTTLSNRQGFLRCSEDGLGLECVSPAIEWIEEGSGCEHRSGLSFTGGILLMFMACWARGKEERIR